jgi:outer membrane immunogenic protein
MLRYDGPNKSNAPFFIEIPEVIMKRPLLAAVALIALTSGSALAADLPPPAPVYKAATPVAPAPSWTGCYIAGGGGYGLMSENHFGETFPGRVPTTAASDTGGGGWMALGGAGCDYQFHFWNWDVVVGAFGDYDWLNYQGTASYPGLGAVGNFKESSAWAGGARLGVLAAPWVLIYTNAGYTGTRVNSIGLNNAITGAPAGFSLGSQNLNGYFVGGGTESDLRFIAPGLFLRTEYRYSSFQTSDNPFTTTAGAPIGFAVHYSNFSTQAVYTELVYRFNFSGVHW